MDTNQDLSLLADTAYSNSPSLRELNLALVREMESWHAVEACPACAAPSVRKFATIRHLPYSRCSACGFTFANPVPSDQVLFAHYNSAFYNNYRRLELRRIRRERYFSISMYTDMRRLAEWLGNDRSVRILDYGCGTGAFLAFLRDEFGFSNSEGLEVNRTSVDIARRHYELTVATSIEELQRRFFDIVILIEVIEHIPHPDSFLKQVADLVRPGGRVLITTPAVDNLLGRFLASQSPHYVGPTHVSLFTQQSLTTLLLRFGFKVERMEIEDGVHILDKAAISLLYDLDFVSPRHDDDVSDAWYKPNVVGRLLGLQPRRSPPAGPLRRGLQYADWFIWRVARRVGGVPMNNHLYVLARKDL